MKRMAAAGILTMLLAHPAGATASAQPDLREHVPDAFLRSLSGEVKADLRYYFWCEVEEGTTFCGGGDWFGELDPAESLFVRQGEPLLLRFDRPIQPIAIRATAAEPPWPYQSFRTIEVPASNPTWFAVDLPPGTYILEIGTTWPLPGVALHGEVDYVFKVTVGPPLGVPLLGRETVDAVMTQAFELVDSLLETFGLDVDVP